MAINPEISGKAGQALGLPPGFKVHSPFPFKGMNFQDAPHAIEDQEFVWIENFVRLGNGRLRALSDVGPSFYTAPDGLTIVYFRFYTLGVTQYCAIFLSDGSAVQLNMATMVTTVIGTARTFYLSSNPTDLPFARQWGSTYLLISNRNTVNDYWAWDGKLLYGAGTAAPQGVNIQSVGFAYSTTPTITAFGGSGSGMTFNSVVNNGAIAEINITNPGSGYLPGEVVQLAFSGGGSNTSAQLRANLSTDSVGGVSVTAGGSGYTTATIIFSGGGGTGATALATIVGGTIAAISVTNPGSGYTSAPAVIINGDGVGAIAQAVLSPVGVSSVTVVNGGSGFTSVPLLTFVGGGGSGATGVAVLTGTSVSAINLTAGGSYTAAPAITFTGGGAGATLPTATAVMNGTSVASVTLNTAGSGITAPVQVVFATTNGSGAGANVLFTPTSIASVTVSSTGQYYTSSPAVEVQAGASSVASATVSLMPFGVSGSAIETYLSRVWIINPATQPYSTIPPGNLWSFSAPGSVSDFSPSDGGGSAVNTDAFLQTRYTGVRQSSGYLYFFGNGSVSVVSNVSTAGTPTVTSYNYQNVDPQAGLSFRDAIQDYGKSIVIGNELGVFGLYGGSLANISTKITQIFTNAVYPASGGVTPSGSIATIYDVKHYVYFVTLIDPDTNTARNLMLLWNEKDWTVASQSMNLTFIATQKKGSLYQTWGTDGKDLKPLFYTPSSTLPKRLETKVYGADKMFIQKQALAVYMQATDNTSTSTYSGAGISGTFLLSVSGIALQNTFQPSLQSGTYNVALVQPNFQSPNPYYGFWGASLEGVGFVMAGLRFTSTSPDFTIGHLLMGYSEVVASY